MARSRNNIATSGLSGQVGEFVFTQHFGKTVVGKPHRKRAVTDSMKTINAIFKQAAAWAKAILTDASIKQLYQSKAKPGQTPYNLAVADFFRPPEIGEIDSSGYNGSVGSKISVPIQDGGRVVSVKLMISKANGSLLEQGDAQLQPDGLHWLYTATTANSNPSGCIVKIIAYDLPGHPSEKQKTL